MVIRTRLFITMEGTLMGAFALVMVCIWNGCFNSIQVICRERDVIKREHRSGMHISSYMPFVLIFQLVFSGGMMTLPEWTNYITPFTISNPALKVLAAQGDYNNRPVMTIWNTVDGMRDREVSATVTLGQALENAYENTKENILNYWLRLLLFVAAFAMLSTITLEFIDKDKR